MIRIYFVLLYGALAMAIVCQFDSSDSAIIGGLIGLGIGTLCVVLAIITDIIINKIV